MFNVAVLDDYQHAALRLAKWHLMGSTVRVEAISEHISAMDHLISRLRNFECIVLTRERTAFPRPLIERLPKLRLIVTTGMRNAAIALEAATDKGIQVCGTSSLDYPTVELTWGLIISLCRQIPQEQLGLRHGAWQTAVLGRGLQGKTLGVLGLGRLGSKVALIGRAFGMHVTAWSRSLTTEKAAEFGATRVEKRELFELSDVVTVHLGLNNASNGIVGAAEIASMKPSAYFVNTARSELVDEQALIEALRNRRIAGAAIDVYGIEPIPTGHPLLSLDNAILTPHLGYAIEENYRHTYEQAVEDIAGFLQGKVVRPLNQVST